MTYPKPRRQVAYFRKTCGVIGSAREGDEARAVQVIAGNATDATDFLYLTAALGLTGTVDEIVSKRGAGRGGEPG